MDGVTLRSADVSDSIAIAALMTELGYPSKAPDIQRRLTRLLAHADYTAVVAESKGEVVGLIIVHLEHGLEYDAVDGRIMGLVVDDRWRGRGLGKHLMQHMERWCQERGAGRVLLTSANRRADAHRFYDAIGYERTGIRFMKRLP
jgi:GNAT superfamily N-acetyltransferase